MFSMILIVGMDEQVRYKRAKVVEQAFPASTLLFAGSWGAAQEIIATEDIDLIITEFDLGSLCGYDLIQSVFNWPLPIVVSSTSSKMHSAIEKHGLPVGNLGESFTKNELVDVVDRIREAQR